MNEQPVAPPPAAGAILPQWAVVALSVLAVIAGIVSVIPDLPPLVHNIAAGVASLTVAFGIASPGIRRAVPPPTNVVNLEQAAETLRKGPPTP